MTPKAQEIATKMIRNFHETTLNAESREPLYETRCANLAFGTAAQKLGASIDVVAPGKVACPYHFHHAQEEMFIILEGVGTLRVANEMLPIKAGDILFLPPGPEYPHQIMNTSDQPLKYLSVSTKESPEVVEYPDSGKFSATAGKGTFRAIQRSENNLDYWEGEP